MTKSAAPAVPAAAAPLTKNQKKKLRQRRARAVKHALLAKGCLHQDADLPTHVELNSEQCSMDWKEQNAAAKSVPQSSVQSCGDSGSAISSTHTFRAAAPTHALPAVTSGFGHRRAPSAAPRLATVTVPRHDGNKAEARLQPAAAAQNRHCRDGEDTTAAQQHPCQQLQQQQQALLRNTASAAAPPAAVLLAGAIDAGRKRDARLGAGTSTDMTATLLVMESLLEARTPAIPRAGKPGAQQDIPVHGNYKRYYGYRWGAGGGEDPRLQVMERSWFAGKRCLDVGCNEGLVSLAVASRFGAAAMLGLDIDASLVQRACANLCRERGEVVGRLTEARRQGAAGAAAVREALTAQRALKAVWFQQGDMAAAPVPVEPGSCDAALCLSVTKWVHLNGGDAGLRALFAALHAALAPGGLLVLEPQPWRSYKQALRKQELAGTLHAGTLAALQLRPDVFTDYLQQEGGFRLVRELHTPQDGRGFDRPMYLLEKLAVE